MFIYDNKFPTQELRIKGKNFIQKNHTIKNMLMEVEEWNETASFDFAMNNFLNNFPADEAGVVREVLANVAERIFSDLNEGDFYDESEFAVGKKPVKPSDTNNASS